MSAPFELAPGSVVRVEPPVVPTLTMAPPAIPSVTVLPVPGPPGPRGPTGGEPFVHTQIAAQSVWTVQHNLVRNPTAWSLFDQAGVECTEYLITHLDLNTLRVAMDTATAGTIRLI